MQEQRQHSLDADRAYGFGQVIRGAANVLGGPGLLDPDCGSHEFARALPSSRAKCNPPDDQDSRVRNLADTGKVQARPDDQNTGSDGQCLRLQQLLELLAHLRRDFRNRRLNGRAQPRFDRHSSYVWGNRRDGQRHADRLLAEARPAKERFLDGGVTTFKEDSNPSSNYVQKHATVQIFLIRLRDARPVTPGKSRF